MKSHRGARVMRRYWLPHRTRRRRRGGRRCSAIWTRSSRPHSPGEKRIRRAMATELLDAGISQKPTSGASSRWITFGWCCLAASCLLWPAFWNGYPIVFADTGTYLSQAIHGYAGWDRPVFYSLFMLALHWRITLWPVVAPQALITAWVLWLAWRTLNGNAAALGFAALIAALSAATWLPWIVSELMPDLFTPLLVVALAVLAWAPDRISSWE